VSPPKDVMMIQKELVAQKEQTQNQIKTSIAHEKAWSLLDKHAKKRASGIIPFPEIFKVLGWGLRLKKPESKKFIQEMRRVGLIEFFPFHGIRLIEGQV
jgi:hypothetical protein